jgi:NAD(P)-dependent dehydrogenase (short-subunit alcohol dehydrogenase family)
MRKNTSSPQKKGTIICTASNAGIYPFPIAPIYAVSKHAVVGAVRSMAKPLEADGIRINGLCPNVIGSSLSPCML